MSALVLLLLTIVVLPSVAMVIIVAAALMQKPTRQWRVEWQQNTSELRRSGVKTLKGEPVQPRVVPFEELWEERAQPGGYVDSVHSLAMPSVPMVPPVQGLPVLPASPAAQPGVPVQVTQRRPILPRPPVDAVPEPGEVPPPPPPAPRKRNLMEILGRDAKTGGAQSAEYLRQLSDAATVQGDSLAQEAALGMRQTGEYLAALGVTFAGWGEGIRAEMARGWQQTGSDFTGAVTAVKSWFAGLQKQAVDEEPQDLEPGTQAPSPVAELDELATEELEDAGLGAEIAAVPVIVDAPDDLIALALDGAEDVAVFELMETTEVPPPPPPPPPPSSETEDALDDWVGGLRYMSELRPRDEWRAHIPLLSESAQHDVESIDLEDQA